MSRFADRFIKDQNQVVKVQQKVVATVLEVECREETDFVIAQEEPGTAGEAGAAAEISAERAAEAKDGFECITAGVYEESA